MTLTVPPNVTYTNDPDLVRGENFPPSLPAEPGIYIGINVRQGTEGQISTLGGNDSISGYANSAGGTSLGISNFGGIDGGSDNDSISGTTGGNDGYGTGISNSGVINGGSSGNDSISGTGTGVAQGLGIRALKVEPTLIG